MFQNSGWVALLMLLIGACASGPSRTVEPEDWGDSKLARHEAESSRVTGAELRLARDWTDRLVSGSGQEPAGEAGWLSFAPPFSFRYGGFESSNLLEQWRLERGDPKAVSGRERRDLVWSDPQTGLRLTWEVTRFHEFPALEWVLWFENTGSANTPVLENIEALDLRLNSPQAGRPYLVHGALGGRSKPDDLAPFSQALLPYGSGATRRVELGAVPPGIRDNSESTNNHLPFFNVETPDERGLIVGVGWSGTWRAELSVAESECRVRSGLRKTHFVLRPGEKVRTPRILLSLWEGKRLHGQNVFRRLLREHYVPPLRGKPQQPLVSVNVCFTHNGYGAFLHQATEKEVLALVDPAVQLGAELFIIDAGWFEGAPWHQSLGNWTFSRSKYPRGFTPISKRLAEAGLDFGLWFGPELASSQAPVVSRHPELLRAQEGSRFYTVRMELPESRDWFLQQVDRLVREEGMTCYRQDLSGRFAEEPADRQGMTESLHVAGLYELWDELGRRHPDLVMEGCCAGGRRIDLETISRFHWHQKSDRWYDSESDQLGLYGANLFLPGGLINIPTQATDDYGAWSAFAGQFCLGWHPLDKDFPMQQARDQVALYKQIRPLLAGDFYPLTFPSPDQPWIGYQFHRPDQERGFALIFRRGMADPLVGTGDSLAVSLRGLEPGREYRVSLRRAGTRWTRKGRELARGMMILIGSAPGVELVTYEPAG